MRLEKQFDVKAPRDAAVEATLRDETLLTLFPETKTEIVELMQNGREQYGMQTFDQHLMDLVEEGIVAYDQAIMMSSSPSDFELHMKTLRENHTELVGSTIDDGVVTGEQRF